VDDKKSNTDVVDRVGSVNNNHNTSSTRRDAVPPLRQVSNVEGSSGRSSYPNRGHDHEVNTTPSVSTLATEGRTTSQDHNVAAGGGRLRNNPIGRGRGQTLPAWMTQPSSEASGQSSSSPLMRSSSEVIRRDDHGQQHSRNDLARHKSDSMVGTSSSSTSRSNPGGGGGGGGGGGDERSSTSSSWQQPGKNYNDGNGVSNRNGGRQLRDYHRDQRDNRDHRDHGDHRDHRGYIERESHSSNYSSDRGGGASIGRGKDINRPAWMSKKD